MKGLLFISLFFVTSTLSAKEPYADVNKMISDLANKLETIGKSKAIPTKKAIIAKQGVNSVSVYKEDNERLRKAIKEIQRERDQLASDLKQARQQLAKKKSIAPQKIASIPKWSGGALGISANTSKAGIDSYWISTNSRKRHNSGCRWFKKSKGRHCSGDDGIIVMSLKSHHGTWNGFLGGVLHQSLMRKLCIFL